MDRKIAGGAGGTREAGGGRGGIGLEELASRAQISRLMFTRRIIFLGWMVVWAGVCAWGGTVPILPLAEVKPGMEGEFRTVIQGTEIRSFPIRIVGVAQNFIGPERPVIFAEALDETNLVFGSVAGMSGSPVYIGGKLVGAYAYGYSFPKEQALFGIQPIEHMLEIPAVELPAQRMPRRREPGALDGGQAGRELSSDGRGGWWEEILAGPGGGLEEAGAEEAGRRGPGRGDRMLPLPMPLLLGGFHPRVVGWAEPYFRRLGLEVRQATAGQAAGGAEFELAPGAPVAGVLLSGDFSAAGIGTVTWREGNRILGFGHPFFQDGPTDMPMAGAEVLTVVQSLASSFKLSNVGPVIGAITQDRLTGIAGEIGRKAETTALRITVTDPAGQRREYAGDLYPHRELGPLLATMAMMESLFATLESEREQTVHADFRLELAGHPELRWRDVASGSDGPFRLLMEFLGIYGSLMDNPFEFPEFTGIDLEMRLEDSWNQQLLEQVVVESAEAVAGEPLRLRLVVRDYRGFATSLPVEVPIPEGTQGETLEILVGDASAANQEETGRAGSIYRPRADARSLPDLLEEIRRRHGYNSIHVKLYRPADGLRLRGRNLDDLPPSVVASITSPKTAEVMWRSAKTELWDGNVEIPGEFRGRYSLRVRVKE